MPSIIIAVCTCTDIKRKSRVGLGVSEFLEYPPPKMFKSQKQHFIMQAFMMFVLVCVLNFHPAHLVAPSRPTMLIVLCADIAGESAKNLH